MLKLIVQAHLALHHFGYTRTLYDIYYMVENCHGYVWTQCYVKMTTLFLKIKEAIFQNIKSSSQFRKLPYYIVHGNLISMITGQDWRQVPSLKPPKKMKKDESLSPNIQVYWMYLIDPRKPERAYQASIISVQEALPGIVKRPFSSYSGNEFKWAGIREAYECVSSKQQTVISQKIVEAVSRWKW